MRRLRRTVLTGEQWPVGSFWGREGHILSWIRKVLTRTLLTGELCAVHSYWGRKGEHFSIEQEGADNNPPHWGAVDSWQLLREGGLVFFTGMATGKWTMLKWTSPYPGSYGQRKLELRGMKLKERTLYKG